MSSYNPRIVAQALDDLQEEIARWSSIASDTLTSATEFQRHAKEAVDRALHNAAILLDRAKDDQDHVQNVVSSVASLLEKCVVAKNTAHQTLTEAQRVLREAHSTLQLWQGELEKALAWLARANARLAAAITEYERALSALRSAEWSLSSAESRLYNCRNDKDRNNCSSEEAAVSRARGEVAYARNWVRAAEVEVTAAKEEVAQAKARVACCEKAVSLSEQAVNLAQEGESSSIEALNSAERSLESVQAAKRLVQVAQSEVTSEVESAESMMTDTQAAQALTDEAAYHLRMADSAEDSAQIYSASVQKELEHRSQQLYELNRPSEVATGSNYGMTGSVSQSPANSTGITWAEKQDILKKIEGGKEITLDDLEKLKRPVSDLRTSTLQEDSSWIQQLIEGERFRDALRDSQEAENLQDAILATLKAINYRRSKS
ncbi:MAG: hypothetical protein IPP66_13665 [Anaerolineales bacterium]|nr:hypothetical protein [Anaerolineales bacterium]